MPSSSSSSSWPSYYTTTNSHRVMYCIWTIAWLYLTSIVQFVYCDSVAATSATATATAAVPAAESIVAAGSPISTTSSLNASSLSMWNHSTTLYLFPPTNFVEPHQRHARSVETEELSIWQGGRFPSSSVLHSRNLIVSPTSDRQDICESSCKCSKDNNFITINCDFSANKKLNPIFGPNFLIPDIATSLIIKLAPDTSLRMERGLLQNSKINRLLVMGNMIDGEQIEIGSGAFEGNRGPFPEIEIVNCQSVILRSSAFSGELKFSIRRSNDVIIYGNAFEDTMVKGTFSEINDLRIEEQAFNKAKARLNIISSNVDNLYRFEASLREIRFFNCTIGTVNSGTFDVISIDSIKFEECKIGVIKSRAVTEKLYSKHLAITGAEIGTIESEAISGSGISELILSKNKVDNIQRNAIYVTAISATIYKNNIKYVGSEWLQVREWSNITIQDNMFGIFGNMTLEKPSSKGVTCKFDGNSLTKPLRGSLKMPHPLCRIREVSIDRLCSCNTSWLEELSDRDLRSETYCKVDDKLQFCFNTTMFNVLKYINEVCDEQKTTLDCVKNRNLRKINGQFFTQEELEMRDAEIPQLVFIAAGAITLILLALIAMFTAKHCANRKKASMNSKRHVHEFSINERRIIEQTVEIIKNKYPHIHKQVSESTKSLLRKDISEEKCVDLVSGIADLLAKCDNTGDFGAFNDIMLKHLGSMPSATAPPSDPIYAEPTAPIEDGGYGSGSRSDDVEQTHLPPEHIYAEPGSVQQPLLRCEYASPRDRHTDMGDLYSEPITDRDPPAYATTNFSQPSSNATKLPGTKLHTSTTLQRPQLPSTSQNLPDVLGQSSRGTSSTLSKPLTNVQKMAQNLENSPQFSGRLPIYTEVNPFRRGGAAIASTSKPPPVPISDQSHNIASSSDSGSDHSGGSDVTVNIDDIEYADA
ncbi:uncharacterized protein LOC129947429 isoform X2 [Eupeodes corollae]|uniref:uncharacterized protein LOC129947429 isoform X2 n=1 Tax=Eupeodes corollae TaxID=290404 RepID=UPI00249251AD|nr:uncharacterized protein LOC129947429 isoform X2 [Eupeodes corollae]